MRKNPKERYDAKIENTNTDQVDYVDMIKKSILNALKHKAPVLMHKAVKKAKVPPKFKRTIVAAVSDTHFGANIDLAEMHGINEYNWVVAARRLAFYIDQVVEYKVVHRKETDLVLQLNGDILAGLIHNQEWFVDLLTDQFVGAMQLLTQAISYTAMHFSKVRVVCTSGNHGRSMAKADKGKATVQKWDSYENMLFESLKTVFANSHKNVQFIIPKAPFALTKIQGHNIFQTHGDTVISVGNPGKTLNMKNISNQINQIEASSLVPRAEKIDVVSVGHVHTPTVQILSNGCTLIINGCLSGTDPFAQSIGIFFNNPTQVLFESTEQYAMGDIRIINLSSADKDKKLDMIIKPYVK